MYFLKQFSISSNQLLVNSRFSLETSQQKIIVSNVASPCSIAVEWLSKKLYWIDSTSGVLEAAEYDGKHRATVYTDLSRPVSLALNPSNK